MRNSTTLYSNIWATLLMVVFFMFSGFSGHGTPQSTPKPIVVPSQGGQDQPTAPITGRQNSINVLSGKVIVVDPGHGGSDPGAVGVGKTTESQNVLVIAWELKKLLESAGAKVELTRKNDVNPSLGTSFQHQINGQLAVRTAMANRSGADIFVSIHNDWNDNRSVAGTTTYYYHSRDRLLADRIQESLSSHLGSRSHGVRRGNFFVLRNTNMPSVLVEVGFMSNKREADLLAQDWYRLESAQGIFNGIVSYFQYGR